MKLQSTVPVTYNDSTSTSKTAVMIGEILEIYKNISKNETEIIYVYVDADGNQHSKGKYIAKNVEADVIFPTIKANLPNVDTAGYSEYELTVYYEGFKVKMAERFSELTVNEIEII